MKSSCINAVLLILALAPSVAQADVSFEPSPVLITSREKPVSLNVFKDGAPVAAHRLGSIGFRVGSHDYSNMIKVERSDGSLRLIPTDSMEIGTYDLVVFIDGSPARAQVRVTLDEEPTSLSARAREQGLTEMDIRHQLGLYTEGRQSVSIELPEWFYVGKRISLNMPTPAAAAYEWYVNGELEDSGSGAHTFTFPLTAPGRYDFRYVETVPGGSIIDSRAHTEAREEPPIAVQDEPGRAVQLAGPRDYTSCTWLVDGEYVSEGMTFVHRFPQPGEYRVTCIATGNETIEDEIFRMVIFEVTIDSIHRR